MAITPTKSRKPAAWLRSRTSTSGPSPWVFRSWVAAAPDLDRMCTKIYDHVTHTAEHLVETAENLEREYGIPIVNKRVSVTPVARSPPAPQG